jgi:hypothetical protein
VDATEKDTDDVLGAGRARGAREESWMGMSGKQTSSSFETTGVIGELDSTKP